MADDLSLKRPEKTNSGEFAAHKGALRFLYMNKINTKDNVANKFTSLVRNMFDLFNCKNSSTFISLLISINMHLASIWPVSNYFHGKCVLKSNNFSGIYCRLCL